MAAGTDSCRLEGWLIKKKGDYHKTKFFHYDNMRWFKLQEVSGNDHSELALCYFKSQRDKEPRGYIFVKDVTEITDSDNSFTVYSPARNMTIEAATPVELSTWLKALIETCPHADLSRVKSTSARYMGSQSKYSGDRIGDNSSKDHDLDYDEYRPLDKDTLLKLDQSSRDKNDGVNSQKSFDRSISLFSRNADGDKNSFYFASSGQTQAQAAVRGKAQGQCTSDTDEFDDDNNQRLMSEGETLDQLGGMHHSHHNQQSRQPKSGSGAPRPDRGSREQSRERDQSREDHRVSGRPTGGYGGGDASTTSRLHKHITRDTPPRANAGSNTGGRGSRAADALNSGDEGQHGDNPFPNTVTAGDDAFNSNSSLYAHRGSPSPLSPRARAELNGDDHPHSGGLEVTSLTSTSAQDQERAARAKATLRERQRRKKMQNANFDESGSDRSARGSSSDSDGDYGRNSRTVASTRRRVASRDSRDSFDVEDGAAAGSSSKVGSPNRHNSSGSSLKSSAQAQAPAAAPPRRARDAMLQEAQEAGPSSSSSAAARVSLDDVLRRRPSTDSNHSNHSGGGVSGHDAEAKESSRSLLAQSLLNSNRGSNNTNGNGNSNEEEDEEVDFKAEMRRYGSRESDRGTGSFSPYGNGSSNNSNNSGSNANDSEAKDSGGGPNSATSHTSTYSGPPSGSSRPPRFPGAGGKPPPPSGNIYSASAAAVIAGKHAVNAGAGGGGNSTAGGTASTAYSGRRGTSTPPRQATDPGAKVDSNFLEEDWDAEETITLSKAPVPNPHRYNTAAGASSSGGAAGRGAEAKCVEDLHASWDEPEPEPSPSRDSSREQGRDRDRDRDRGSDRGRDAKSTASAYPSSSVRADPNWLDENFDDN